MKPTPTLTSSTTCLPLPSSVNRISYAISFSVNPTHADHVPAIFTSVPSPLSQRQAACVLCDNQVGPGNFDGVSLTLWQVPTGRGGRRPRGSASGFILTTSKLSGCDPGSKGHSPRSWERSAGLLQGINHKMDNTPKVFSRFFVDNHQPSLSTDLVS